MKLALLLCLCLLAGCKSSSRPDLQRMLEQPRADVYEASPFFPDGKVIQTPPAGTVARGEITDPLLADGTVAGNPTSVVPLPVTPELLKLGQGRFGIYCAPCHGAAGYGGSVVAMNMQPPRPPSLHSDSIRALAPGVLYQRITNGFGRMPSLAADLSVRERWAVVAYVEVLGRTRATTAAAVEDSSRAASLLARRGIPSSAQARAAEAGR